MTLLSTLEKGRAARRPSRVHSGTDSSHIRPFELLAPRWQMRPIFRYLLCSLGVRLTFSQDVGMERTGSRRLCTVDELLSFDEYNMFGRWSELLVDQPPFDCTCPMLKARYFCPSLHDARYPMWKPRVVEKGKCSTAERKVLAEGPFPSNSTVLIYGNSHLRQVFEAIGCMFADKVESRRVSMPDVTRRRGRDVVVGPDTPCRNCGSVEIDELAAILVKNSCMEMEVAVDACSCSDGAGEFKFTNGAALHYNYAGKHSPKHIEDAVDAHGNAYEDYDVVFANAGNPPTLSPTSMLASAWTIKQAGVRLIWTSSYGGGEDPKTYFTKEQQKTFNDLEVSYLPVHRMVEGLDRYTKGSVEGDPDSHFCMPGPPNEIAIFMLQLVWSHMAEQASVRGEK